MCAKQLLLFDNLLAECIFGKYSFLDLVDLLFLVGLTVLVTKDIRFSLFGVCSWGLISSDEFFFLLFFAVVYRFGLNLI